MKLMKTKLGLSALAFACACVGVGVMNVQSPVTAKAEVSTDGFYMENGAAVCLEEDFSGIRWKTTVEPSFWDASGASMDSTFGVIVAPTNQLPPTGELTHNTTLTYGSVTDLPLKGIYAKDNADAYYSVIDYNDIWESYQANGGSLTKDEALQKAYAMELTARAYVDVNNDGNYIYADVTNISTSRSARQVAIAAELSGEIDALYRDKDKTEQAEKGVEYYGYDEKYTPDVESTGAVGTTVINLEKIKTQNHNAKFTFSTDNVIDKNDIDEVLVGAERMRDAIATTATQLGFTILAGQILPTGEQYATVFMKDGTIHTYPVVCATKVLKTADDLNMFADVKGPGATPEGGTFDYAYTSKVSSGGVDFTKYWVESQNKNGYYVLGDNIDYGGETFTVENTGTWNSIGTYANKPIGLTGTFNGMGYKIDNVVAADGSQAGIFGIINGGTLKNVAFTRFSASGGSTRFGIAWDILNATIENVYVSCKNDFTVRNASAICAYMQGTTMNNVVIETEYNVSKYQDSKNNSGSLVAYGGSNTTDNAFSNVFVVSNFALEYSAANKTAILAENETEVLVPALQTTAVEITKVQKLSGVYRYDFSAGLPATAPATANYSKFVASNGWDMTSGKPVWANL